MRENIPKRCDICGKFRKLEDLRGMVGERDEEWVECKYCMSGFDYEQTYGHRREDEAIKSQSDKGDS